MFESKAPAASSFCTIAGRPRRVSEPLYLDIAPKPLFKPALALAPKRVRNYALRMGDIWTMPKSWRRDKCVRT
jgi:hypothetical protein